MLKEAGDKYGILPIPEVSMNVFCIVGKIVELPKLKEAQSGVKVCNVALQVERPFANSEGIYEYDLISIEVWRGLAETLCKVSKIDDWISVKGRIANRPIEKDGRVYNNYTFIAEKIGFLQGK